MAFPQKKTIALALLGMALVAAVALLAIPRLGSRLLGIDVRWDRLLGTRSVQNPQTIRVSGNIEVTHTDVSFKIAGRVVARPVDEGETIHQGAVVAVLDSADLQQEVDLRRAERQAAKEALAELQAGSRPEEKASAKAAWEKTEEAWHDLLEGSRAQEIKAAKAAKDAAETEMNRLKVELGRAERLLQSRSISKDDFDQSDAAYRVARDRFRQADEQWSLVVEGSRKRQILEAEKARDQARAQYDLVMAGPRVETIAQAQAKLEQAEANLKLAEIRLGYARLVWPPAGVILPKSGDADKFVVLSKNVEPGEYVAAGTPVVTVGDLVDVWLRAYVDETDLGRVKLGQKARVTTDTYPGKAYEGRISFISDESEFTPKNVQTEKERVKLVYRIKIDITNPQMELKPGMPADAEINTAGEPTPPASPGKR